MAAASTLQMWAMVVNPFFSPDIRLQPEHGHRLVTRGPYRLLRHPGYLAMLLAVPASALAIGSCLALVPAALFCLVILKRVRVEEQFLQSNLAGYTQYMDNVRGAASGFPPRRSSFNILRSTEAAMRTRQDLIRFRCHGPSGERFLFVLFRPALSRARQAVKFSCALAARRSSASAARPSGFPVPSQKDRLCRTASFPAPPENAELGLGSRCHLPLGAPQESRAEKGDSNHVSESHFAHRLRRQRRTTEIRKERHSGRSSLRRDKILAGKTARASTTPAPNGIGALPGANSLSSPASWRKAPTFRSRASCVIASTRKTAEVMRTTRRSSTVWLRFMSIGS